MSARTPKLTNEILVSSDTFETMRQAGLLQVLPRETDGNWDTWGYEVYDSKGSFVGVKCFLLEAKGR